LSAPVGNQYAAKDKLWRAAILRALEKRSRVEQKEMLDEIADKLIDACLKADMPALKEFGDRVDGKPKQIVEQSGLDGEPIKTSLTVEFVGSVPGQT
jgi:hypothetical protein